MRTAVISGGNAESVLRRLFHLRAIKPITITMVTEFAPAEKGAANGVRDFVSKIEIKAQK